MLPLKLRDQEKIAVTVNGQIEAVIEIVKDRSGQYKAYIQNTQVVQFHSKSHLMKNMLGKRINEILEG